MKRPAISAARRAAFDILLAVERSQLHSDELLRGRAVDALSAPDRNLATALVLGVLRWQIRIDQELQRLLKRPNAKLDREIQIALRLGAFQILFLDRIPARAAIDESVELAKQAGHRFASGMVNAVLRNLDSTPRAKFAEESPAELALAYAHPAWMVERWASFYGIEAARAICNHGQMQPALSVRIKSANVEAELTQAGIELEAGELVTAARTVVSGDITATPALLEGRVRVQDAGSQLVGELAALSGLDSGQEVKTILDACAAPGGKTLILAERHPQARIVACDASEARLTQLRERLAEHADRLEFRHGDAGTMAEESVYDLVLADVPCSGTGTLGRNPEIRHRLRLEDLPRQSERQRAILRAALRAVRPGGRVVYSTCSLEPEENEQVVAATLAETPDARLNPLDTTIEALGVAGILTTSGPARLQGCQMRDDTLRLLPGAFHNDGFFIALIEKTK